MPDPQSRPPERSETLSPNGGNPNAQGVLDSLGHGWVLYGLVFTVVFLVWLPSLFNGIAWDDYVFVLQCPQRWHLWNVADYFLPRSPSATYIRPLPSLTFYLDEILWGAKSYWGWHLTNVFLHATNATLLAAITAPLGPVGQLASSLTFGLHPVHTEPVGWISARYDLLAVFFLELSILLFLRRRVRLSAMAFLAGLFSKEMAISFPLLVSGLSFWKRRSVRDAGWHWAALCAYSVYRILALHNPAGSSEWTMNVRQWAVRPWLALAFPLPIPVPGWSPPGNLPGVIGVAAGAVCLCVALLAVLQIRRTWPLGVALVLMLLPLLPLFLLGPSFQFGRFLYWPAIAWGVIAGTAIRSARSWSWNLLLAYFLALVVLGIPPRVQYAEVGTTGGRIARKVTEAVPGATGGTRLRVVGIPTQVNGWSIFGPYLDIAVNEEYGYPYQWGGPKIVVTDLSWIKARGGIPPEPRPGEIVLQWDGSNFRRVNDSVAAELASSAR